MVGVEADLEDLYRRRAAQFRRALIPIAGIDGAGEAVQEGFARALAGAGGFRGGSLEAWVWRTLVRCALDQRRPRSGTANPVDEAAGWSFETWDSSAVVAAIRALPPQRRQVVFLRYFADLSYREIAEVLAVEVGTVSATLAQAHAALRESLESEVRS